MKILLVNTFYAPDLIGGAEHSLKKLAENLVLSGNEVMVLCSGENEKEEYINNVKVIRVKMNNFSQHINFSTLSGLKKYLYKIIDLYNVFNYFKLKKKIMELNPDIIHTNNLYGISPIIWKISQVLNKPVVHTLRDYFLICPKSTFLCKDKCEGNLSICNIYKVVNRRLSKNVNFITAPSNFTLNLFKKNKFFKNIKGRCIYNAIDVDKDKLINIYNRKQERDCEVIKFVFLGTLDSYKGIDFLLETIFNVRQSNWELHIAGSGILEEKIIKMAYENDNIVYHGKLSENEVGKLLEVCDVLIAPSLWDEPFGRVVIDAYKYALPVIATKSGGLQEIVDNGKSGILIEPNKVELQKAIEYFMDRKKVKKMYEGCLEIIQNFTIENQVKEFEKLYKEMKDISK